VFSQVTLARDNLPRYEKAYCQRQTGHSEKPYDLQLLDLSLFLCHYSHPPLHALFLALKEDQSPHRQLHLLHGLESALCSPLWMSTMVDWFAARGLAQDMKPLFSEWFHLTASNTEVSRIGLVTVPTLVLLRSTVPTSVWLTGCPH
jgi:hypothetical protein